MRECAVLTANACPQRKCRPPESSALVRGQQSTLWECFWVITLPTCSVDTLILSDSNNFYTWTTSSYWMNICGESLSLIVLEKCVMLIERKKKSQKPYVVFVNVVKIHSAEITFCEELIQKKELTRTKGLDKSTKTRSALKLMTWNKIRGKNQIKKHSKHRPSVVRWKIYIYLNHSAKSNAMVLHHVFFLLLLFSSCW